MKVNYQGVEIESTSTEEILKLVRGLQRSKGEVVTSRVAVVTKTGRPKKHSHNNWTSEEINFILKNIDQPAGMVKRNFPFNTHTRNAVTTMYYMLKSKNMEKVGVLGREILKANSL